FLETQSLQQHGVDFVLDFLPEHPIYASLLPKKTQNAIQKTQTTSKPALKMLRKEGFEISDQLDVFDAGPVVASRTRAILSISSNSLATVSETAKDPINSPKYIISNTSLDFRACCGRLELSGELNAIISEEVAEALRIK